MRGEQIVTGQASDAFQCAIERTAIGVIPKGDPVKGLLGDFVGVFLVRLDVRNHLAAHPLNGVFVETRLLKGRAQKVD